jgi:hypothetical protein
MRGSIRIFVGIMIAFGAVGHLDYDPDASELIQTLIAAAGLALAAWGVRDMNRSA